MQLSLHRMRGFTLVELIITVTIIGMMAVFIIPNYNKTIRNARERAGMDALVMIYAAQQFKKNGNGNYQAGANLSTINTALNLSIINNDFAFSCTTTGAPPTTFDCRATMNGDTQVLKVTDTVAIACCSTGPCYKATACP